jgi:hypothetical protein
MTATERIEKQLKEIEEIRQYVNVDVGSKDPISRLVKAVRRALYDAEIITCFTGHAHRVAVHAKLLSDIADILEGK